MDYIDAAKYIKKIHPNTNFYIAGPLKKDRIGQTFALPKNILNNIIQNKNIVKYIGYQKSYLNIFNKMDCLISPSLSEGAGTSVMEAMMSGIYVIAYKNSGHNYILKNTNNYLCKQNNYNEIMEGVEFFLNMNQKQIYKNKVLSYNKIKKNYTTELIVKNLKSILQK